MIKSILLLLLVAGCVAVWTFSRQAFSKWWLNRRVYLHVDSACGAKIFEAEYAKTMRNTWQGFPLVPATWLWPHPELSGVMARPHWWRRKIYVTLGFVDKPPLVPYRKEDIVQVDVTYTSEADHNDSVLFPKIERAVARALSLPWHEDLFVRDSKTWPHTGGLVDHRPDRDQVSLIVAERERLPRTVTAREALNGRAEVPSE